MLVGLLYGSLFVVDVYEGATFGEGDLCVLPYC